MGQKRLFPRPLKILVKPLRKIILEHGHPPENLIHRGGVHRHPPENLIHRGGVHIKWNGPNKPTRRNYREQFSRVITHTILKTTHSFAHTGGGKVRLNEPTNGRRR